MVRDRGFPLFQGHLDLAHSFWERVVIDGDIAIDATVGNGHDTLTLAQLVGKRGRVIGLDIQKEAIESAKKKIISTGLEERVELFCQSHETFPDILTPGKVRLVVYNLGYLPGGDKELVTRVESTIKSIEAATDLLMCGGVICVTCYSGHEEGAREEEALSHLWSSWDPAVWSVTSSHWKNRKKCPSLHLIQKKQ